MGSPHMGTGKVDMVGEVGVGSNGLRRPLKLSMVRPVSLKHSEENSRNIEVKQKEKRYRDGDERKEP